MILIQQHILGINGLGSPYKHIAADVNRSGSISTFDLIRLRKLILGIDAEFRNNTSWRFVDKDFAFPDPDPLQASIPESISLTDIGPDNFRLEFVAVKVGDVSTGTGSSVSLTTHSRSKEDLKLTAEFEHRERERELTIYFTSENMAEFLGCQFTLEFPPDLLSFKAVVPSATFSEENLGLHKAGEGLIAVSWMREPSSAVEEGAPMFALVFESKVEEAVLHDLIRIGSRIAKAEAYDEQLNIRGISLETSEKTSDHSERIILQSSYPNPFSHSTSIRYYLPKPELVQWQFTDDQGRVLKEVNDYRHSGWHELRLHQEDLGVTGLVVYRFQAGEYFASGKMVIR